MPPRLSHKKSRLGCKRCKVRKVKCDETRPRCLACTRHGVSCDYPNALPFPGTDPYDPSLNTDHASERRRDQMTELRLMHEWMAYVCESLPTWEFWKFQAPLVAFKYRYLLDALLAMAALHCSRQKPRMWMSLEGRMVTVDQQDTSALPGTVSTPGSTIGSTVGGTESNGHQKSWKGALDMLADTEPHQRNGSLHVENVVRTPTEMIHLSRNYFDDALAGFQREVVENRPEKMQGLYMCSVLVSYYSLFTLGESVPGVDESEMPALNPIQWYRISRGSLHLVLQWRAYVGNAWVSQAGGLYGEPDLTDRDYLFQPSHRQPFEYLLAPVPGSSAAIPESDLSAYQDTLSYVGLMYRSIINKSDTPFATCRRVVAMPSCCSDRFSELLEASQPRAYVILIHVFACLKLQAQGFEWFEGIAERQIPMLCGGLPREWDSMVEWPLRVARGEERPDLPLAIQPNLDGGS